MTHCSPARSVFKTRPRVGRATFTTVLSRMTMKVPRMIAMSGTSTERVLATEETGIDIYRHRGRTFYCRPAEKNPDRLVRPPLTGDESRSILGCGSAPRHSRPAH